MCKGNLNWNRHIKDRLDTGRGPEDMHWYS